MQPDLRSAQLHSGGHLVSPSHRRSAVTKGEAPAVSLSLLYYSFSGGIQDCTAVRSFPAPATYSQRPPSDVKKQPPPKDRLPTAPLFSEQPSRRLFSSSLGHLQPLFPVSILLPLPLSSCRISDLSHACEPSPTSLFPAVLWLSNEKQVSPVTNGFLSGDPQPPPATVTLVAGGGV